MRTYTLDQLVYAALNGFERLPMIRAMRALEIDEDASYALCSSERPEPGTSSACTGTMVASTARRWSGTSIP